LTTNQHVSHIHVTDSARNVGLHGECEFNVKYIGARPSETTPSFGDQVEMLTVSLRAHSCVTNSQSFRLIDFRLLPTG